MSKVQQPDKTADLKLHFLVLRCQVGDEGAFRELHETFSSKTLRYLKGMAEAVEAEDINQEVWLNVYKRISALSNPLGFRMWLFQMARNKLMDHFRIMKRVKEFQELFHVDLIEESIPTESQEILPNENLKKLEENLEKISPKHREVLTLNFLEGMDYEEIALITGSTLGTIKSRIHNAKVKLKYLIT